MSTMSTWSVAPTPNDFACDYEVDAEPFSYPTWLSNTYPDLLFRAYAPHGDDGLRAACAEIARCMESSHALFQSQQHLRQQLTAYQVRDQQRLADTGSGAGGAV